MRSIHLYLLLLLFTILTTRSAHSAATEAGPTVQSDQNGISIYWKTPAVAWQSAPDGTQRAVMPGFAQHEASGQPIVPVSSVLVALPRGAEPAVAALYPGAVPHSLVQPLGVAPRPHGVFSDSLGQVTGGAYTAAELSDDFTPHPYTFEEIGTMRGTRLARVSFFPVQAHALDSVSILPSLELTISFGETAVLIQPAQQADLDPLSASLAQLVVNPEHVAPRDATGTLKRIQGAAVDSVAIQVAQPGITAVTGADLTGAGFSLSGVNPKRLQLWQGGVKVPIEWDGDGDTQFETNERFLFFADPAFSRWSNDDSYLLTVESTNGTRMGSATTTVAGVAAGKRYATAVLEENAIYSPNCYCGQLPFGRDGDRWVWDDLRQPGRPSNSYVFDLLPIDPAQPAELTAWLIGFTSVNGANPDHRVDVLINNTPLGSVTWDARTAVTKTLTVPAALLQTSNELSLNLPGIPGVPIDGVWFDAARLRYALGSGSMGTAVQFEGESPTRKYTTTLSNGSDVRVFDITNPAAPIKLSGMTVSGADVTFADTASGVRRYAVSNADGLLSPSRVRLTNGLLTENETAVDYLIVSHPDFITALSPLVTWHESSGLDVAVEDVTAIYDEYGNGRPSPDAIKTYLAEMYVSVAPTYVLLVGDATIDPRQYLTNSSETYLPAYLAEVDPWIGEVPADNRYVTVDGDDIIPDMLIGRLPVNTPEEASVVVNKIVGYQQAPPVGSWNGTVAFVADDQDPAGDFASHSNDLIDLHISPQYNTQRIYFEPDSETAEQMAAEIQQSWNRGTGMIFYTGHSSTHQWGAERFFHLDDVSKLNNGPRLPIVLQMTCLSASFQRPDFETLDEALLRHPGGGAVAVWGSTGLGVATGHERLASAYLDAILGSDPTVGPATLAGKLNVLLNAPASDEIIDTYTLLGDPAMRLHTNLVSGHQSFLPLIKR